MAYDIILGREEKDKIKYDVKGTLLLGKHYVKMGQETTVAQNIFLDINKAHVVFVAGKRSSGKSYALGVIAEGIANQPLDIREKLSVIMLDTMGIFWTMKYPNNKDAELLKEWKMQPSPVNAVVYVPEGYFKDFLKKGIPVDKPFAINPSELNPEDWWLCFDLPHNDPIAVFVERIILNLKDKKSEYSIKDILKEIHDDKKDDVHVKNAAENRFLSADKWGLFNVDATPMRDLAKAGQVTILDMSPYAVMANGWIIKNLAVGLICQKLFMERMKIRKEEELASVKSAVHYLEAKEFKSDMPIVWLILDEAHEMLPYNSQTPASSALITLLREGRQPGIAMVLATQQPGKIHTDAMTQSDIILAHRVTAKIDTEALGNLMQTFFRKALDEELNVLPRVSGACIAIDDVNERIHPMQVRPRSSWHGGSAPGILEQKKSLFG